MRRLILWGVVALMMLATWIIWLEPVVLPTVPVLFFHKTKDFERTAAWLSRNGFRTLSLEEFRGVLRGTRKPGRGEILLTFDDGDASNYAGLMRPLIRHREHAILFLVTDRLGEGPPRGISPSAPSLRSKSPQENSPAAALRGAGDADRYAASAPHAPNPYSLRWSEVVLMARAGIVELGSHSASHSFAFGSESLLGFATSPNWKTIQASSGDSRASLPVFLGRSALLGPSFHPDSNLVAALVASGSKARTVASGRETVRNFRLRGGSGRFEARSDYEARLNLELAGSRRAIEEHLGAPTDAFAWPWGQRSPELVRRAHELGYDLIFTTEPFAAVAGTDSLEVPRIGAEPDPAWLSTLLWIYERRTLGAILGRLHPASLPRQTIDPETNP